MYIYIDYFSYCIYQDSDNIGQNKDINNKINSYKLKENKRFYNCLKNETNEKLKEYNECMEYNLGINIESNIEEIIGRELPKDKPENDLKPVKTDSKEGQKNERDISLEVMDNIINTDSNNKDNIAQLDDVIKNKEEEKKEEKKEEEKDDEKEEEIDDKASERSKIKLRWAFFFGNIIELLYLSFHNIILIIIIIISMMISGLLSLFYIIISLYFLITSSKMYFGQKYFYPKAIKKILRVAIIVDIALQILYQMPQFYRDNSEKTTLDKILDVIGFNKIINYGKGSNVSYDDEEDIQIYTEQMILVFCKALTYFFMGIQILIYSSENFQEHYFIYLVTRKLDLKRKSLMNAFRFNNKRINTMNESVKFREDMILNMEELKKMLEKWTKQLSKLSKDPGHTSLIGSKAERKESNLRGARREEKIFEEQKVKKYIKKLILSKALIRAEIWFYQFSIDYSKINPDDRDIFERDVIQGRTTAKTFIEKLVDAYVDNLNLGNFTEAEMVELKKFFVDTEEQMKKLKEQRENKIKEKETLQKLTFVEVIKEEKEKLKIVDLTQPKFKEIEDLLKSDLFLKYLKTSYLIKSLAIDLLTYCSKKFQFVCYFIMVLNHIENASIISMVYPISIFCYAIIEYPRPSKNYWNFCIIYSIVVLALKYMLQLQLFVEIFGYKMSADNQSEMSIFEDTIKNLEYYKIGLKYMKTTYEYKFFKYIVFDALIIVFLLINNLLLIINGLWEKREQEIENIYHAIDRVTKTKYLLPQDIDNLKEFNAHFLELDRKEGTFNIKKYKHKKFGFFEKIKKVMKPSKEDDEKINNIYATIDTYKENDKKYFERLFPLIRNEKPGNDFYAKYTIAMILVIIFIIVFYTSMIKDVTYGALNQETNQFSGSMILYLLLHIFYLCYDRVLYISQNRNNLKYQYIIYTKSNMKQTPKHNYHNIRREIIKKYEYDEEQKENFIIPPEYVKENKNKYEIVPIQIETYNKNLLQKYILHLFIVLAGHAFIFIYAPFAGNYNINHIMLCSTEDEDFDECNDFNDNPALIWFYILYLIYFIFSGMQIKFGYYDMKRKSLLKAGYTPINKTLNTTFISIPFIKEIKLAIDWAFTPTCLDIFQWSKYENVYDMVYTTYCNMKAKNTSKIGQKVGKVMKAGMGGLLSFTLILLLVLPILLFSSLNPTNELNNLNGATIKIDLSFKDSFGLIKNYTVYESTKPETILDFMENEEEFSREWSDYDYSESTEVNNFPREQIQRLNFTNTSERHWGLTNPHIENLIKLLSFNDSQSDSNINNIVEIQLIIDYQFERYLPIDARKPGERHGIVIYDKNDKNNKTLNSTLELVKIRDGIKDCTKSEATFKNLYSAPIRLTANANSREITDEDVFSNLDIYLGFDGCKIVSQKDKNDFDFNYDNDYLIQDDEENAKSYLEAYFTFGTLGKHGKEGIFFYILSDKVSSTTSGYSVVTFYVTFVLLVGNYVRNFFAGEPSKITLTEMPQCKEIINLCEGIRTARHSFKLEQEENLYYILMELMRSPDYLKYLTKSSVDQYNDRKKLTEKSNDPNRFSDDELDEKEEEN